MSQSTLRDEPHFPSSVETVVNSDTDMSAYTRIPACGSTDEGYHTGNDPTSLREERSRLSTAAHTIQDDEDEGRSSNGGLELLGRGVKEVVDLVNRLRQSGVAESGLHVPLPQIAVVGNQSAGKSSLIEAMTEIQVPRASGACTRCPLEINLTENNALGAKWKCTVSIRVGYMYAEGFVAEIPGGPKKIGPWLEQTSQTYLFEDNLAKEDVQDAIYRAQKAVLNPHRNFLDFKRGTKVKAEDEQHTEDTSQKFSPNVVHLDITGPGLPNLSFVDLPGIIENPETGEEYLRELIRLLASDYIKQEDCITLLCMPMSTDADAQSAPRLAKELAHSRCIGALTKPDEVRSSSVQQWIPMLQGKTHRIGHGYFVTKQPNNDQLKRGITHAEARAEEDEFFRSNDPYNSALIPLADRFGTMNLVNYLSKTLTERIHLRLPEISRRIQEEAEQVQRELDSMPPPPIQNAAMVVLTQLNEFKSTLSQYMEGTAGHNKFMVAWKEAATVFSKQIQDLRPIVAMDDSDMTDHTSTPRNTGSSRMGHNGGTPTPTRMRTEEVCLISDDEDQGSPEPTRARKRPAAARADGPTPKRSRVQVPPPRSSRRLTLFGIRRTLQTFSSSMIPTEIDPKARYFLISSCVRNWNAPLQQFLKRTRDYLLEIMRSIVGRCFSSFEETELYKVVSEEMAQFVDKIFNEQLHYSEALRDLEISKQWTLNSEEMSRKKSEVFAKLSKERREYRCDKFLEDQGMNPNELGIQPRGARKPNQITDEELGSDPFTGEIDVMAFVLSYYELAATRFVDNITHGMVGQLFHKCGNNAFTVLSEKLRVHQEDGNDHCRVLIVEHPDRELKRTQLTHKKEILRKAQQELALLG